MTVKCTFCNDTKREPGQPGPCTWCECAPDAQQATQVQRFTIARLRYAGGDEFNVKYVSEVDYDRVVGERDDLRAQLASARHLALEFGGVIDEYKSLPCSSLEERMFKTLERYRPRLKELRAAHFAALSASAEPATAKQETRDEMRIRHKREFDALDGSGFHYEECRCGAQGSYPVEVKHCVCGKPFASAEPSAREAQALKDESRLGIERLPAEPSAPVELDERAEFDAWTVRKGRVVGYMGWREDFVIWKARAALERKP